MKYKLFLTTIFASFLFLLFSHVSFAGYNTDINIPTTYKNMGIPEDLIVLPDNNIWYADSQGYRIVKINPSGTILRTVGRQGNDEGEFESAPIGLTTDSAGKLYVLTSCRVYTLDSNGGYLDSWGACGTEPEEFSVVKGIE